MVDQHQREMAARVARLRDQAGMTNESLARKSNLSVKTVSRFVNGKHEPREHTLKSLAKALSVTPEVIRGRPPSPLGLGATEDQLDDVTTEFRDRVTAVEEQLERIEENVTSRVEHDQLVERLLKEQTHLLERIRVLLAKNEQIMQPDRIAQAYRDAAKRDVQ